MPDKTPETQTPPRRALTLDVEKYQRMLDAPDVTPSQREEMIKALWSIITAFSDLGYDLSAAKTPCGQDAKNPDLPAIQAADLLDCKADYPKRFAQAVTQQAAPQNKPPKGARHD